MSVFVKVFPFVLRNNSFGNPLIQSVRFRKPRWLPIAKSKEFYVRKPTPIDPEENDLLRIKYMNYRSSMKAIRHYLKTQAAENKVDENVQHDLDEAADLKWMEEQVMEWNRNVAVEREERQNEELRLEGERLQMIMEERAEGRLQESLAAERRLHANIVASKTFVTEENVDLEIEKMLDSRSDYNFALTRDGKILEGEYPDRPNEATQSS